MFKAIIVICALLQLAAALPRREYGAGRIIGGTQVTQGDFPGLVSLQHARTRSHFCGGGIISTRLILTAGHCFYDDDNPKNSIAYVGSIDNTKGGVVYTLQRVVVHEDFDYFELVNDVTLLQTTDPIELGPNAAILKLPAAGSSIPDGTKVVALGWGTTSYPNIRNPKIANYVELGVVSNNKCSSALDTDILGTQICVGGEDGRGLCFGDSGSPLILNGDTTVGIVSWGEPCGIGYPDVFTRTSSFVDWVDNNKNLLETLDDQ